MRQKTSGADKHIYAKVHLAFDHCEPAPRWPSNQKHLVDERKARKLQKVTAGSSFGQAKREAGTEPRVAADDNRSEGATEDIRCG